MPKQVFDGNKVTIAYDGIDGAKVLKHCSTLTQSHPMPYLNALQYFVDNNGNIYRLWAASANLQYSLSKYNSAGELQWTYTDASFTNFGTGPNQMHGCLDNSGNFIYANQSVLGIINIYGVRITHTELDYEMPCNYSFVIQGSYIYVAGNDYIYKYNLAGIRQYATYLPGKTIKQLDANSLDGTVIFSAGSYGIGKLASDGSLIAYYNINADYNIIKVTFVPDGTTWYARANIANNTGIFSGLSSDCSVFVGPVILSYQDAGRYDDSFDIDIAGNIFITNSQVNNSMLYNSVGVPTASFNDAYKIVASPDKNCLLTYPYSSGTIYVYKYNLAI